jgi:Na+/H+ antiporter NhaD/arsenite permease-like protein
MELIIIATFVLGYTAITMEHTLKIDKLIPALLMMVISWTMIALNINEITSWIDPHSGTLMSEAAVAASDKSGLLETTLLHHFGKTAEILIFLMGAMAIVEMIDHFEGFSTFKKVIKTKKKITILWIVSALAFGLSAIIDNLTATIVLITILRKIVHNNELRMWYAGFIIIAANAGGAWTPIGDVTTTMLWMADKITTGEVIKLLILPSLVCAIIPLLAAMFIPAFKGTIPDPQVNEDQNKYGTFMLIFGLLMIVFVPVFKTVTHLPPYVGMMFSLAVIAITAEILSNRQLHFTQPDGQHIGEGSGHHGPTLKALSKIEMPSILFFLGILMTVASMESLGLIMNFGNIVSAAIPESVFITLLGMASAIIDNVPLVAASIGMFTEGTDDSIWHFIAYAAGTGGSMLIIGSAAGVVAMGMEKISFFWYLKRITLLAAIGYFAGIGVFLLMPQKTVEGKKDVEAAPAHHGKKIEQAEKQMVRHADANDSYFVK